MKVVRRAGAERSMVRDHTERGESASVWDPTNPHESQHGRHTDADLYRHEHDGRVTRIDRVHIPEPVAVSRTGHGGG